MRRKETRTIDGAKYVIRQMSPFAALRVQAQLVKLLGEPLARLITEADSLQSLLELDLDGDGKDLIAAAVESLGGKLDPNTVVDVARQLVVGNVTGEVNGDEVDIDDVETYEQVLIQHDPWHQLKLLQACLVVQFRPRGAGARTAPAEASAKEAG